MTEHGKEKTRLSIATTNHFPLNRQSGCMRTRRPNWTSGQFNAWKTTISGYLTIPLLLNLTTSCVGYIPPAVPPTPAPRIYGVAVDLKANEYVPGLPDRSEPLAADTKSVLKKGARVGILPPDDCRTTKAGVSGERTETNAEMRCGVLLSGLEVRLAQAGYDVVSWQVLKPGDNKSGIERARAQKVDVLFEIDQFSAGEIKGDNEISVKLRYYEVVDGKRRPVDVSPEVRKQCGAVAREVLGRTRDSLNDLVFEGVLSVKAVQVETGRAVWYYQKSVVDVSGESAQSTELLYHATGTAVPPPREYAPGSASPAATAGGWLVGIGSGVLGVTLLANSSTQDGEVKDMLPVFSVLAGLTAATGVGVLILGNQRMGAANQRALEAKGTVKHQSLEEFLCRPDALHKGDDAKNESKEIESDEFTERKTRRRDPHAERRAKVAERIADDFSNSLKKLVGR